ncbi:MAG: hypothetical protein IPJ03_11645 [Ignavibacteriales bacterium]|nr:hypothetical protein [Ignavibacteriales bacterium]
MDKIIKNFLTLGKAVNKFNQTNGDVLVDTVLCDRIRKIKQEINFIKSSREVKSQLNNIPTAGMLSSNLAG